MKSLIVAVALGAAGTAQAQVAFPVSFAASAAALTPAERAAITSHVQAAGRQWTELMTIAGPRSLEVEIALANIATANGSSVTSAFAGTVGNRNLFEQAAAAELRNGVDPNAAEPDIRITFGTTYLQNELWFDPNPNARIDPVPSTKTDAMSVILHEFGHALAYNGWANGQGQWPDDFFSTFDRWMIAGAPTVFSGSNAVQQFGSAPALTTNNIHHWANGPAPPLRPKAPIATAWKHGVPIPPPGCEGVPSADAPLSRDALGKGSLPPGLIYELMNGVVFYRGSRYDISALDLATLEDVGIAVGMLPLFEDGFEGN